VYYGVGVPRGDGHKVLLLPGFLGSDGYLTILAGWLARVGYRPAQAGILFNVGSLPALLRHVECRAERLAEDGRRITIIGHSLGGMFARLTAIRRPDLVLRAVTLGSPLNQNARAASHPAVRAMARILLHGDQDGLLDELNDPLPPDVRSASIYSRGDAVVDWRACLDRDPHGMNVEVRGSHTGLTWNADVYHNLGRLLLS
jgi:pimeloyl-ACP methyl ester carboxylesterase